MAQMDDLRIAKLELEVPAGQEDEVLELFRQMGDIAHVKVMHQPAEIRRGKNVLPVMLLGEKSNLLLMEYGLILVYLRKTARKVVDLLRRK